MFLNPLHLKTSAQLIQQFRSQKKVRLYTYFDFFKIFKWRFYYFRIRVSFYEKKNYFTVYLSIQKLKKGRKLRLSKIEKTKTKRHVTSNILH